MIKRATRARRPATRTAKRQLAKYRAKRDFKITPEPSGDTKNNNHPGKRRELTFVVQMHAASHLHYDFRLEWNGVLKSWAVAKGPSYYPGDKRLAIQVEDHPLDYGSFEGIVPKGQYGGGTVMLWDHGWWEPVGDAAEGLRKGNLKFVLHGEKLRGQWVLVRMAGKFASQSKPSWLLIKERDGEEHAANDAPITDEEPNSVLSRRSMDSIAKAHDAVWDSNAGRSEGQSDYRSASRSAKTNPAIKSPKSLKGDSHPDLAPRLAHLSREALPLFVSPQLASMAKSPPEGNDWVHELKLDGYRIQARVQAEGRKPVQLLTRTSLDWTHRMRSVADALAALPIRGALFDGEVVVLGSDGTTSFADLQAAFQEGTRFPLTYFIFDLLHLDGRNLRNLPLLERKEILTVALSALPPDGALRISEHMCGNAESVFDNACKLGAEGIISKLAQGKYVSGRSNSWLNLKCHREQEFVIGGFTLPLNGTRGIGALLLGYYNKRKLLYAGRTGTGFTQKTHRMMRDRLDYLHNETSPFAAVPPEMRRGVHWVKPKLVAQVAFANWTTDNLVRQAAFKGLREDKSPNSVQREEEQRVPQKQEKAKTTVKSKTARRKQSIEVTVSSNHSPIRLTHPDKLLDRSSGLTKRGLADYYDAVASHMLPHIGGRPLSLVRCMNGTSKPCFFQKHVNENLPPDIERVEIVDKKSGKPEPYITLSTPEALVELAQLSVLEIHSWGSKNDSIEKPDRIVIDLDPDAAVGWKALASAAAEVRQRMKSAGLESFLKTTGGKGLHIIAPIRPEHDWPIVKNFAHQMVLAMEADNPSLFLTRMTKTARKGKIYLDYLRNERGATSIAPYSPRARDGVSVALPLNWSELKSRKHPAFRVSDFSEWKSRLRRDPWEEMSQKPPRLKIPRAS